MSGLTMLLYCGSCQMARCCGTALTKESLVLLFALASGVSVGAGAGVGFGVRVVGAVVGVGGVGVDCSFVVVVVVVSCCVLCRTQELHKHRSLSSNFGFVCLIQVKYSEKKRSPLSLGSISTFLNGKHEFVMPMSCAIWLMYCSSV